MDILAATRSYESWLAGHTPLYQPDLDYKHKQMADPADPFPFFRGTYYRWAQRWAEAAGSLADAPAVLAVGDLHVENFGTWRDADGRLCWGINDFDEVDRLPYTHDLVRLAASVRFAKRAGGLDLKLGAACKAILAGYREALDAGGIPFVLEERNLELRALAMSVDREPVRFWKKLTAVLTDPPAEPPEAARAALLSDWPGDGPRWAGRPARRAGREAAQLRVRPRVGMGSLGKPRYVALAEWAGSWVAREAKAATPPATAWAAGRPGGGPLLLADAARQAVRCPDPFYRLVPGWVVRRLGPRCSRIELTHLEQADDTDRLLRSMGSEAANVHLGTPGAAQALQADLARRPKGWLEETARPLARLIERDWGEWREAARR
jgi:hypothetical protein